MSRTLVVCSILVAASAAQARTRTSKLAPTEVTFTVEKNKLVGWLWKPEGRGPFPAIVYNHGGTDKDPGDGGQVARFFVKKGYVFLIVHRRGYGKSEGSHDGDDKVAALESMVPDVIGGITYLQGQKYVDSARLAVGGCSSGGIMTVLTAEKQSGIKAGVAWAAGSLSWKDEEDLRKRLKTAAKSINAPIFALQAQNDYNTTPTQALGQALHESGKPWQAAVFPKHGDTAAQGHAGFCNSSDDWGDSVAAFLATHLK